MASSIRVTSILLAGSLGACGMVASPPVPPASHAHLSSDAQKELRDIAIDQFAGKAVIKSEHFDGDSTGFTFDPASGPVCIFGAPYVAYLKETGSDKLLLFLGGGGACWSGFCQATPTPDGGIIPLGPLHVETAANPFHGYNVLYMPYCDGSVFSGNNDVPDAKGDRHFHGRQNLAAGFDLLKRLGDLHTVVVAGVSAGAYGTLGATALARLHYPTADLFVYDDSGPWIQNLDEKADVDARLHDWRFDEILPPGCTACQGGRGQLIEMMAWLLQHDDQLRVGMLSFYEDSVIGDNFTKLSGPQYKQLLLSETGKLHDAHPDRVSRFMLEGTGHVLTLYWPSLLKVNNIGIQEWTAGLVTGGAAFPDLLGP